MVCHYRRTGNLHPLTEFKATEEKLLSWLASANALNGWARQYADNINSNRVWNWNGNMDPQIPRSARAAIKQRAVDQGLIANIPVNSSTATPGFADFRGFIRNEVQMPEFLTKPDGTEINLWRSTDDVKFRWLDERVRQADPDFTNHGDEGYTWHHHE